MKSLTLLFVAISITAAICAFTPVSNYDLNLLEGDWNVQSVYDTVGSDYSLSYCFQLTFNIINQSAVNLTIHNYDGFRNSLSNDTVTLYPDASNPAILYQDPVKRLSPLLVLNTSSIPYWVNDGCNTSIFAFNYTSSSGNPQYIIMGASRWYDTNYDIRPFLEANNLPINNTKNFWFVDTACDTHFNWYPLKNFDESSLLKTWNLIAVYDPVGSDVIPWYTEGGLYDWKQAYCADISFQIGSAVYDQIMTLSLKSLYQGGLQRTWRIFPMPDYNSVLMGFNINENTVLYVQYADLLGNLILTTGTTTSFFLSTTATSLTPANRGIFEVALKSLAYDVDLSYIYPIDHTNC